MCYYFQASIVARLSIQTAHLWKHWARLTGKNPNRESAWESPRHCPRGRIFNHNLSIRTPRTFQQSTRNCFNIRHWAEVTVVFKGIIDHAFPWIIAITLNLISLHHSAQVTMVPIAHHDHVKSFQLLWLNSCPSRCLVEHRSHTTASASVTQPRTSWKSHDFFISLHHSTQVTVISSQGMAIVSICFSLHAPQSTIVIWRLELKNWPGTFEKSKYSKNVRRLATSHFVNVRRLAHTSSRSGDSHTSYRSEDCLILLEGQRTCSHIWKLKRPDHSSDRSRDLLTHLIFQETRSLFLQEICSLLTGQDTTSNFWQIRGLMHTLFSSESLAIRNQETMLRMW